MTSLVIHFVVIGWVSWFAARQPSPPPVHPETNFVFLVPDVRPEPEPTSPSISRPPLQPQLTPPEAAPLPRPQSSDSEVHSEPKNGAAQNAPPPTDPADASLPTNLVVGDVPSELNFKEYISFVLEGRWIQPPFSELGLSPISAEAEISVGPDGKLFDGTLTKSSGRSDWDASVREVLSKVTKVGKTPPRNFPKRVTVVFETIQVAESVE